MSMLNLAFLIVLVKGFLLSCFGRSFLLLTIFHCYDSCLVIISS